MDAGSLELFEVLMEQLERTPARVALCGALRGAETTRNESLMTARLGQLEKMANYE